jgi:pimeloyl-ACP methyl ester carboxylesterase
MNDDASEYCVPGTRCSDKYVAISPGISLRITSFEPPCDGGFPTVVFVPGWISLMSAWDEVLRELSRDFKVVYIETREKISSRVKEEASHGVSHIAKDIARVVSGLNEKNGVVLLGSSLGATAVIESCRFLTEDPRCLVLIAPNAEFRIPPLGLFIIRVTTPYLYFVIKPIIKWYLRTFRLDLDSDRAQYTKYCNSLDAADPWKLKKAAIAFSDYKVWNTLECVSMPVLLIDASLDVLHEPENLKKMASHMKQVTRIDMKTNKKTHSNEMVYELRNYLRKLRQGGGT